MKRYLMGYESYFSEKDIRITVKNTIFKGFEIRALFSAAT